MAVSNTPSAPPQNRSSADGLATYCKPCHNAKGKAAYTRLYGSTREYHLRRRYGITSADVEYAFRRLEAAPLVPQFSVFGQQELPSSFGYLFDGLVTGMAKPKRSLPKRIGGIQTPDARTVVFRLTHPAGDFGLRLAMPAAGPIPVEVAGCFAKPGDYGRDLVSSGPYMVLGAEQVDSSFCTAMPMPAASAHRHAIKVCRVFLI